MTPTRKIEDLVRSARTISSAATDERIIALGEAALAKRNEPSSAGARPSGLIGRMIRNTNWIKLATAAVILMAIGLGMYALTGSVSGTSITMAQVRQAMQEIDWVQMVSKDRPGVAWYSFASKVQIVVEDEGKIVYFDFKTGKELVWSPGSEEIYESPIDENRQFAGGVSNIFEGLTKAWDTIEAEGRYKVTKEISTYRGQKVEVWTARRVRGKPGPTRTETTMMYIDMDKKLPIAATDIKGAEGDNQHTSHVDFKYPETGPAHIYEAGAPRSARIVPAPKK